MPAALTLTEGLHAQGDQSLVGDWMQREVNRAEIDGPLENVLQRLQTCQCRLLSVTEAGRLVGIVNMENIMELISIQKALQEDYKQTQWRA